MTDKLVVMVIYKGDHIGYEVISNYIQKGFNGIHELSRMKELVEQAINLHYEEYGSTVFDKET